MSSEVTFEGESSNNVVGNISIVPGAPKGMLAWLVKNKVVKDAKQAEMFLFGVAICAVILAIVIFLLGNGQSRAVSPSQMQSAIDLTHNQQSK